MTPFELTKLLLKLPLECLLIELCLGKIFIYLLKWNTELFGLLNFDFELAGNTKLMQLNELDELRLTTYENAKLYKERTKRWHDARIKQRKFQVGDKVLDYNYHFHLFPKKLWSGWGGPFEVNKVFSYDKFWCKVVIRWSRPWWVKAKSLWGHDQIIMVVLNYHVLWHCS